MSTRRRISPTSRAQRRQDRETAAILAAWRINDLSEVIPGPGDARVRTNFSSNLVKHLWSLADPDKPGHLSLPEFQGLLADKIRRNQKLRPTDVEALVSDRARVRRDRAKEADRRAAARSSMTAQVHQNQQAISNQIIHTPRSQRQRDATLQDDHHHRPLPVDIPLFCANPDRDRSEIPETPPQLPLRNASKFDRRSSDHDESDSEESDHEEPDLGMAPAPSPSPSQSVRGGTEHLAPDEHDHDGDRHTSTRLSPDSRPLDFASLSTELTLTTNASSPERPSSSQHIQGNARARKIQQIQLRARRDRLLGEYRVFVGEVEEQREVIQTAEAQLQSIDARLDKLKRSDDASAFLAALQDVMEQYKEHINSRDDAVYLRNFYDDAVDNAAEDGIERAALLEERQLIDSRLHAAKTSADELQTKADHAYQAFTRARDRLHGLRTPRPKV